MVKCYYCGGFVENRHRVDVEVVPTVKRSAHKGCVENSKKDFDSDYHG